MLKSLFEMLATEYSGLNVFRYLTFRAICSILTALVMSFVIGPILIRKLNDLRIGETIREDGPTSHQYKSGTPTMGGALILVATVIATLMWSDLGNRFIWITLFTCVGFGLIGWIDDRGKLRGDEGRGLSKRQKFFWQSIVAACAAYTLFATAQSPVETQLIVPLLTGHAIFSGYLGIPHISGAGEVLVFCSALMGAGLGFLWFNTYPAQVFMGDVGALAIGAALGTVAVIVRQEIVLAIMGGIFVIETLSVILQVISFRLTGRRLFRMAPLHHHYELKGWEEPKIIVRFWIISLILVLIGLATLKIR